ncbi:MAG TPA: YhjD/YihY/BrkB family envelope integrity protein [Acidimicrobiia bacterium]|nr:YhjD/YihY/BrkB family envelope integrity protein [Acidimicrobiia bacterium]
MIEGIRSWAARHRGFGWLVFLLDVQARFSDLQGGFLAAAVTLMAFLSLFPLLVSAVAVVGFVAEGSPDFTPRVIDALGIPEDGTVAEQIEQAITTAGDSARAASVVGILGLLWSGLGLVMALQRAINSVWQVTGRGWRDRLAGLAWLAGAAVIFAASFGATAAGGYLPGALAWVSLAVSATLLFLLWLWAFRALGNLDVGWRALVPGAAAAAVGMLALEAIGSIYVPRAVASASALYGSIGLVFAALAWLFVFGRLIVYATVVNVVVWERRHGTVVVPLEAPWLPDDGHAEHVTRTGTVAR